MNRETVKKGIKILFDVVVQEREKAHRLKLTKTQKEYLLDGMIATASQESDFGRLADKHSDPDDYGIFGLNINNWRLWKNTFILRPRKLNSKSEVLEYIKKDDFNLTIGMWYYSEKFITIIHYPRGTSKEHYLPRDKKPHTGREVSIAAYSLYTDAKILPDNDSRIQGFKRKHNPSLLNVILRQ